MNFLDNQKFSWKDFATEKEEEKKEEKKVHWKDRDYINILNNDDLMQYEKGGYIWRTITFYSPEYTKKEKENLKKRYKNSKEIKDAVNIECKKMTLPNIVVLSILSFLEITKEIRLVCKGFNLNGILTQIEYDIVEIAPRNLFYIPIYILKNCKNVTLKNLGKYSKFQLEYMKKYLKSVKVLFYSGNSILEKLELNPKTIITNRNPGSCNITEYLLNNTKLKHISDTTSVIFYKDNLTKNLISLQYKSFFDNVSSFEKLTNLKYLEIYLIELDKTKLLIEKLSELKNLLLFIIAVPINDDSIDYSKSWRAFYDPFPDGTYRKEKKINQFSEYCKLKKSLKTKLSMKKKSKIHIFEVDIKKNEKTIRYAIFESDLLKYDFDDDSPVIWSLRELKRMKK